MVKERLEKIVILWRRMDRIGENLQWTVGELRRCEHNREAALDDVHARIEGLRKQISSTMQEIMRVIVEEGKQ